MGRNREEKLASQQIEKQRNNKRKIRKSSSNTDRTTITTTIAIYIYYTNSAYIGIYIHYIYLKYTQTNASIANQINFTQQKQQI